MNSWDTVAQQLIYMAYFIILLLKTVPISSRITLPLYLCYVKGNNVHKSAAELKREISTYVLQGLSRNLKHIFESLSISYYSLTHFPGHFSLEKRYDSQITTQFLNQC